MQQSVRASSRLFYPEAADLRPAVPSPETPALKKVADEVRLQMESLIAQRNYPCVAAVQSMFKSEYRLGVYGGMGRGDFSEQLTQDLLLFLKEQQTSQSPYLSFWAVFPSNPDAPVGDVQEDFENRLWRELSFLTGYDSKSNWDPHFSANPEDKNFCLSLGGEAFFVVGLHPESPRKGRRFPYEALVFNVYAQFRQLAAAGQYVPMVQLNRQRDLKFQGTVNPMTEKYGETWEAIQFSGRENSEAWKCPFHRGLKP